MLIFNLENIENYSTSPVLAPILLLLIGWKGKKEMLMTLVRHPRNSHPEMDSPFKIPSKYAPDEGRIGSFFWDGARSSPYFTHNALGQKMLNAFLVQLEGAICEDVACLLFQVIANGHERASLAIVMGIGYMTKTIGILI